MNQVNLIGRVGKDPESRIFDNGNKVASFSFATTEKWNKDGEKKELTEWHNIVVNGKTADIVEKFIKKGDLLSVTGKIHYRNYENQQGQKVYITEIFANNLEMLGGKKEDKPTQQNVENLPPDPIGQQNDLPF